MDKRILAEYDVMIGKAQSMFDIYTEDGYVEELEPIVEALGEYLCKLKLARYRLQGNDKEVLLYTAIKHFHNKAFEQEVLVKGVVRKNDLGITAYVHDIYGNTKKYAYSKTLTVKSISDDIADDLVRGAQKLLYRMAILTKYGNVQTAGVSNYDIHVYKADGTEIK